MKRIEQMLGEAVGRSEVVRTARAQRILRQWNEIVGSVLGERSVPDRYERGTVWVAVAGAAWAQEIRMRKAEILDRLNARAHESGLFLDLRCGVRTPRAALEPEEEPAERSVPAEKSDHGEMSIHEIAARRLKEWADEGGA
jgi:hypothetical protein